MKKLLYSFILLQGFLTTLYGEKPILLSELNKQISEIEEQIAFKNIKTIFENEIINIKNLCPYSSCTQIQLDRNKRRQEKTKDKFQDDIKKIFPKYFDLIKLRDTTKESFSKSLLNWQHNIYAQNVSLIKQYGEEVINKIENNINNVQIDGGFDSLNETALLIACRGNDYQKAKFILEDTKNTQFKENAKRDINHKGKNVIIHTENPGETIVTTNNIALWWAEHHKNQPLIDLLKKYGAK